MKKMQDEMIDSSEISEIFANLGDAIANIFLDILEAMWFLLVTLLGEGLGQIVIILLVISVVGQILLNVYNANPLRDSTDKIMENKNKTGFFHPENVREKNNWVITEEEVKIEPETIIRFSDAYCGNCNLPIEKDDVFCANCGLLLEEAKAKFLLENNWDELSKEFYKTMKEVP